MITDRATLVNVSGAANSNKFYRAELHDNGTIVKNWGRVGAAGQTQSVTGGRSTFDRLIQQKIARGYSHVDVGGSAPSGSASNPAALKAVAAQELATDATDPIVAKLIDQLVTSNRHQIFEASGGMITVAADGEVTTPLGVINPSAVQEARLLLPDLAPATGKSRSHLTERYLRLIPQKVPAKAGWADNWITEHTSEAKQAELLDALESAFSSAAPAVAGAPSNIFRYQIAALDPKSAEHKQVVKQYNATKQTGVHSSARLTPKRVYALTDLRRSAAVDAAHQQVRNVQQLWHGTSAANMLSILAKGLYVPPARGSTIRIAGRMFGDGIYLSESASKSLNYSTGFWGGTRQNSTFMLLTETAMGSEYRPEGRGYDSGISLRARTEMNKFGKPYNSINVRPGRAGVINHEAIVWDADQVRLSWLLEF